ncbi:MAG: pyruvate, water dikinase regulatory protein [Peptoniphilaceae bacterium]|nr:kinase/pyrophosphorylase [Peptoniphilaceae bacterium]MDD7383523.1 kinase/pyrophosphorylase [Peptoniphilaceae bacterium]MDY3738696.1 pyruvate, water dikinase regulatory protein [Peptoniphilaceae bacterium]
MSDDILNIYVLSDSTGETAINYTKSITAQFQNLKINIKKASDIKNEREIDKACDDISKNDLIIMTIANFSLRKHIIELSKDTNTKCIDLLGDGIRAIEEITGEKALWERGLIRKQSEDYFSMIDAIEFAVKYDDGKDPRGLLEAEIVLVGVSRTSKTPLSMLLATKNYKVCNLPLVPEVTLPQELFEVDSKKIVGLIINPDKLEGIRAERAKIMGLGDSVYSDEERIEYELNYASEVFDDLGCEVINVTDLTIEQTANKVLDIVNR